MTCHRDVHLQEIPRVAHACLQHGPMCYVLEMFPQLEPSPLGPAARAYRDNYVGRYWSCCTATQQDDLPLPIDHLHPGDDRPFRNPDPMMAADIESIEDSIPDEDSFPDRSMDHSSVPSHDGMDDAEIEAAIEEAAIEEASFPEVYGTDALHLASDAQGDALFGDDRPPRIPIAMMDDPDRPFHTAAEVAQMQRIVRDYETAEEQIAMEALLNGYTDE